MTRPMRRRDESSCPLFLTLICSFLLFSICSVIYNPSGPRSLFGVVGMVGPFLR